MEIAVLTKKKMKNTKMTQNHKIIDEHEQTFTQSIGGAYNILLIWRARKWPMEYLLLVLKPWTSIFTKFGGVLYADHVRFNLHHPYSVYQCFDTEHMSGALHVAACPSFPACGITGHSYGRACLIVLMVT